MLHEKGIEYNVKKYHYQSGIQVRMYSKTLVSGFKCQKEVEQTKKGNAYSIEELKRKERNCLNSSRNRTVQNIYGITRANNWKWFITFTFDRNCVDSSNLTIVSGKVRKWLNNQKMRYAPDLKYIIVPELHADRQHWHVHGLLSNVGNMVFSDSGVTSNDKIIYNMNGWRYGFSTATAVEDTAKVSAYITKYITKDLCQNSKNAKRFWCSSNCLRMSDVLEHDLMTEYEKNLYIRNISDKINFMKTQKNSASGQVVKYIEVGYE